eukprot:985917-Amphidinium_carterae.1
MLRTWRPDDSHRTNARGDLAAWVIPGAQEDEVRRSGFIPSHFLAAWMKPCLRPIDCTTMLFLPSAKQRTSPVSSHSYHTLSLGEPKSFKCRSEANGNRALVPKSQHDDED